MSAIPAVRVISARERTTPVDLAPIGYIVTWMPTERECPMTRLMVVLIMSALSLDLGADTLSKCIAANGKVEYRDYACDVTAASAQKVTVRENTSGSVDDLASIRRRDAEFNKSQAAKRSAQDKADRQERVDAERRFQEERAHRDRQAVVDAIRESSAPNYNYRPPNNNSVPYEQGAQPPKAAVVPATPAKPPSGLPAQPKRPNA